MLQRFSRLRKGWAALAAGALVASLLAVSATTATATTDTPDERSRVTVCVGEALDDWGFSDVPDNHIFHDAINCLAHFGITIGTGDGTTFTPDEPVNRWQMMLFLTRALEPADINLSRARPQNFTDVGNLNDEARDAIDLLVTNGIATAASSRTFDPYGIVDRTEMALLLINFLDAAGDVVEFTSDGDILLDANDDGSQSEPDDYFKDARDEVPVAADRAISAAYELGITTGADPTPAIGAAQPGLDFYYRPRGSVTRGQMAAFITRTLGHTLARPTGLSAQYDGDEIRVSVRDDDFEPLDDVPIDMFFIETEDANRAFTSRDTCADVDFVDGLYACEIDDSDLTTDADGEVSLTVPELVVDGTDTTVWIWTGRDGDEVGRGTDLLRLDIEPSEQAQAGVTAEISTGFRGSKVRFGTTVTFTVQLQDARGNDVSVGIDGERPAEWELVQELLREDGTPDGDSVDGNESVLSKTPRTVRSNSRGRVTFSLSVPDPNRGSVGDSRTRTFKLVPGTNAPSDVEVDGTLNMSSGRTDGDVYFLEFSDAAAVLANSVVTVTLSTPYINVPSSSGSVRNTATVSVVDEYGEALSAARVRLTGSPDSSLGSQFHTVGRSGVRRFSYSYDGSGAEVEILTATVDPDGKTSTTGDEIEKKAFMFWSDLTFDSDTNRAKHPILFGDTDRDEIIVDSDPDTAGGEWPVDTDNDPETVPERVEYDINDRFDVQGPDDTAPVAVSGIDAFERALAEYFAKTPKTDDGTGACLEWSNYDPGRSRAVTQFTLWRLDLDAGEACNTI